MEIIFLEEKISFNIKRSFINERKQYDLISAHFHIKFFDSYSPNIKRSKVLFRSAGKRTERVWYALKGYLKTEMTEDSK